MKHARKLTSLLLALVMVFALAVTAFAAGAGSITVDNPIAGQDYTAYKIFDVVYNDGQTAYSYTIDSTSAWFNTVDTYSKQTNSGLTLTKVGDTTTYVVTTTGDFSAPPFADALKKALDANPTAFTGTPLTKSGSPEKASATVNELGYYFVTSTTGALCNLTTTNPNANIHDKNDMPFKKEVDKTNVDVGQTVTFKITGKVPDYTGFNTYTYLITDTMTDGLTFNRDSLTVKVGTATVTNDCTITYDAETAPQTFTVSIPVLEEKYDFGAEIVVTYTATVNKNAIAVISTNQAKLTYSNDPTTDATKDSQTEEQKVYTSKIVIDKFETDKKDTVKLEGAEFVLYKKAPNDADQNAIQYYKQDETTKAVSWVDAIADATKVTTDANGAASFDGLANGTYYLVETKAPAGYNQLTEAKDVVVTGSITDSTKLSVTAEVANSAGTLLPSTGGMGTTVFYVLGAVLVVGAGVLLVTKKRMSQSEI